MIEARAEQKCSGDEASMCALNRVQEPSSSRAGDNGRKRAAGRGLPVTVTPWILFCRPPTFEGWRGGVKDDMRRGGERDGVR